MADCHCKRCNCMPCDRCIESQKTTETEVDPWELLREANNNWQAWTDANRIELWLAACKSLSKLPEALKQHDEEKS